MSTNIISFNPTIENEYEEDLHYATTQEENFCNWEHQVQQSIKLAISLLKGEQELDLASKCADYIENQYKEAYQGKTNIDGIPLAKAELRNNWDQKLFDFIRTSIWKYLTKHINLNDGLFPPDEYNNTSNAIFEVITPAIYGFASKVVRLAPSHTLGY